MAVPRRVSVLSEGARYRDPTCAAILGDKRSHGPRYTRSKHHLSTGPRHLLVLPLGSSAPDVRKPKTPEARKMHLTSSSLDYMSTLSTLWRRTTTILTMQHA